MDKYYIYLCNNMVRMDKMRYFIKFSYSGDKFNGYQKQSGLRTVQGEIEKILTMINDNKNVKIYASSRTDAKVNAKGQCAHFDLEREISVYKLKYALNNYLPDDIYVSDMKIVDNSFHARYMAKSKLYEYKINIGEYDPLLRTQVYQYCKILNVERMKEAIKFFKGEHDFTTFACAEDKREDKVRKIIKASLIKKGDIITISFLGTGFLKYQIRNMVGFLIEVGQEKKEPSMVKTLLEEKDRKKAGVIAPPEGLTLVQVNY